MWSSGMEGCFISIKINSDSFLSIGGFVYLLHGFNKKTNDMYMTWKTQLNEQTIKIDSLSSENKFVNI